MRAIVRVQVRPSLISLARFSTVHSRASLEIDQQVIPPNQEDHAREVLAYHQATKHQFGRYAAGPRGLDWNTQPDPFLRYDGAPVVALKHVAPSPAPLYEQAFVEGEVPARALDLQSISQLFSDSLALSAWKQSGEAAWSVRINPSSGNLHPTEGYLVSGPVRGLCSEPMVAHYAPREHVLERRTEFSRQLWERLCAGSSASCIFVGLTSIHWREAWKYGERAYRYCQHDVGHAIAALSVAAAALGWKATLIDGLGTHEVAKMLGVFGSSGPEAQYADCLLAVYPQDSQPPSSISGELVEEFVSLPWAGTAGPLSSGHVRWSRIERVATAAVKPPDRHAVIPHPVSGASLSAGDEPISLREIIFQRRSAVALDGRTGLARDGFHQLLRKTIAGPAQFPFNALPWRPRIDLAVFVHRIAGLDPGLYMLVRDDERLERLRKSMSDDFSWEVPEGCPDDLGLYCLAVGDARRLSARISCHQDIAADGCFSLGMIADFERPMRTEGAWIYPRLFWECGVIGQVLYLEAEALGIRGTGIGCFFDDPMHDVLGVNGNEFQSLYHFTVGGPVEDPRIRSLPAYPDTA